VKRRIGSLCSGYEGESSAGAMLLNPSLNVLGAPDLAHAEHGVRLRKVPSRHELLHPLAADTQACCNLGRAHQVMHDGNHSHNATCRLTRRQACWKTSHMPSPVREAECVICETPFKTRSLTAQTCSYSCRAYLRERRTPSPGAPQVEDPPELVDRVRVLYEAGHTMREVAEACGTTIKVLQRLMPRHGIERRGLGKREQRGANNDCWLGDDAGYSAMHLRVITARGRPQHCACCDTTDPRIQYHWANLTGHYEDINDYARLCPRCHRRLDARRRAQLGRGTMQRIGGGGDV